MSPTWVLLLTCSSTTLFVATVLRLLYDACFRYRSQVGERLDELSGKKNRDDSASLLDLKQLEEQVSKAQGDWRMRLGDALRQSGLRIRLSTLLGISCTAGFSAGLLVALASQRWWLAPVGMAPGAMAPLIYVYIKRARRIRRLASQLPEAFDVIGRAVRAGHTLPAAFQIVADDFEAPISDELRYCYEQQHLGMPYDVALRDLARRTGIMELQILVVGLLVQVRSGGSVVELLTNLSTMVRKRLGMQMRIKALTGEGRMQAAILIVLPVLAFGGMLLVAPDYVGTLVRRPGILAATGAAQLLGTIWIRRIVRFEV